MDYSFANAEDGSIQVELGPEYPIFEIALHELISTRPLRGGVETGLSTYYIDYAETQLRHAMEDPAANRVMSIGQISGVWVAGDYLVANMDDETDETESIPIDSFVQLLSDWRAEVVKRKKGTHGA
jgi:hypothetical protein